MQDSKDWLNANKQITTKSSTPLSKKCFWTIKRKFSNNERNRLINLSEYVYHLQLISRKLQKPKENNKTLRFYLIIIRRPKLTKQCRQVMDEMWRKRKFSSSMPGFQAVQPPLKLVWRIFKNQKINLSYYHATLILEYTLRKRHPIPQLFFIHAH